MISTPIQFCLIYLLCSKNFIQDCVHEQTFVYNLALCPSNFNILIFSYKFKESIFQIFNKDNVWQLRKRSEIKSFQ